MSEFKSLLQAYGQLVKLKKLPRTGWLRSGVGFCECESVAEHSFATGWLGYLIACEFYPELDAAKVLLLGSLHDLGEAETGDVLPWDKVLDPDFDAKERLGALKLAENLKALPAVTALYDEYAAGVTPEARLVRQIDKLEILLQAYGYEQELGLDLSQFFDNLPEDCFDAKMCEVLEFILSIRKI